MSLRWCWAAVALTACSACGSTRATPARSPHTGASSEPSIQHRAHASTASSSSPSSASALPGACDARSAERVCLLAGIAQFGRASTEAHFEERPARGARLRAFEIDRDEVTAQAYAHCVAAGRCRAPVCDDGTTPSADAGPARCVAWSDARAYCESVGGRLPYEVEWERAAAGLLPVHRAFPWGEDAGTGETTSVNDLTPEGVRSLGGGVAEWVDDVGAFYVLPPRRDAGTSDASTDASRDGATVASAAPAIDTSEREGADAGPEFTDAGLVIVDEPRGPREGVWRVVRGGDEHARPTQWTTTRRRFRIPLERRAWLGFRCAYDL